MRIQLLTPSNSPDFPMCVNLRTSNSITILTPVSHRKDCPSPVDGQLYHSETFASAVPNEGTSSSDNKPSPFTPYTALKIGEIGQQFFPPGVLQVLGGDEKLGPWIVEHPGIHKISFTGSIATGKKIMQSAAKTLKRVTLELYVHP